MNWHSHFWHVDYIFQTPDTDTHGHFRKIERTEVVCTILDLTYKNLLCVIPPTSSLSVRWIAGDLKRARKLCHIAGGTDSISLRPQMTLQSIILCLPVMKNKFGNSVDYLYELAMKPLVDSY